MLRSNKSVVCFSLAGLALGLLGLMAWKLEQTSQLRPVDMTNWSLRDFASHVQKCDPRLRFVPSSQGPQVAAAIYLTKNPHETWESLQSKARQPECIAEWKGSMVVSLYEFQGCVDASAEEDCCQRFGNFVVFGDPEIIQSIKELFNLDS
jgi:hypothetical protein